MIFDVNENINVNFVFKSAVDSLQKTYPQNINIIDNKTINKKFLANLDLLIISVESWKLLLDKYSNWLRKAPSVLIIKH
jgi:hypothetical protein